MIMCDWCERDDVAVRWRIDTIERGEGFSYDVCDACRILIADDHPDAEIHELN